ncbi:unnamed protein product [Brassicogethes aeneus]|uniref:Chemosensory protein n=1 Tax=Brassicogethes aeneus TaxID=1431903 RepID=A0A9P0AY41_BRAAE|nr:unnamed protein product [Brassicogethes aeneus]
MKYYAFLLLSASVVAVFCDEEFYQIPEKYRNIDITKVLENERLIQTHCNCILEKENSKCNNDGEQLKKYIPEAISNKCKRCTEKQKESAIVVIKHLKANNPEKCFDQLVAKFDPKNEHAKELEELLV